MPSTITVATTMNWASSFVGNMPLNSMSGSEPAITIANVVKQTILGPPFAWRWNRGSAGPVSVAKDSFSATVANSTAKILYLEKVVGFDSTANQYFELSIQNLLVAGGTGDEGRPTKIAPMFEDPTTGDLTLYYMPAADASYPLTLYFQKTPALITATSNTWTPIPDEYSYIYQYGFLAAAMAYIEDPRFPIINQKFLAHLLGASQGLDEMQKNLFMSNWLNVTQQLQGNQLRTQMGNQLRGSNG